MPHSGGVRVFLLGCSFFTAISGGCGGGPECALDTDCPLVTVCQEGSCVAVAAPADAGLVDLGDAGDLGVDAFRDADVMDLPDLAPPVLRRGGVIAKSQSFEIGDGVARFTSELTAVFAEAAGEERCEERRVGACVTRACTFVPDDGMNDGDMGAVDAGAGDAGPDPDVSPSAGFIFATAGLPGAMGPVSLGLTPGDDGNYRRVAANEALWDGTDDVSIRADGARVPSFEVSLPPPPQLELLSPPGFAGLAIDPRADLALRWVPLAEGFLRLDFVLPPAEPGEPAREVACVFASADGEGAVGAEVFRGIARGTPVEVQVQSSSRKRLSLEGGWEVEVAARSDVRASGGRAPATGVATLEPATMPEP